MEREWITNAACVPLSFLLVLAQARRQPSSPLLSVCLSHATLLVFIPMCGLLSTSHGTGSGGVDKAQPAAVDLRGRAALPPGVQGSHPAHPRRRHGGYDPRLRRRRRANVTLPPARHPGRWRHRQQQRQQPWPRHFAIAILVNSIRLSPSASSGRGLWLCRYRSSRRYRAPRHNGSNIEHDVGGTERDG